MNEISDKEHIHISKMTAFALSMCWETDDAGLILGGTYREFMRDKSPFQASLVVNALLLSIARLIADYEAAQDQEDNYIPARIAGLISDRTPVERDECLSQIQTLFDRKLANQWSIGEHFGELLPYKGIIRQKARHFKGDWRRFWRKKSLQPFADARNF